MSSEGTDAERKYSVYIALGGAIFLGSVDLIQNGAIVGSLEVVLAMVAFAGLRQAAKSLLKR